MTVVDLRAATILPIFATPFAVVTLSETVALHGESVAFLDAHAAECGGMRAANHHRFESDLDVLAAPCAPLRRLAESALAALRAVVERLNASSAAEFAALTLEARVRPLMLQRDGHLPARGVSRASWCALYCLEAPSASSERADSGVLRLLESRLGTMFTDASNAALEIPYRAGHYTWRPSPGQLALFPASVLHEIATLRAEGRLTMLAIQARFVAPGKQALGAW